MMLMMIDMNWKWYKLIQFKQLLFLFNLTSSRLYLHIIVYNMHNVSSNSNISNITLIVYSLKLISSRIALWTPVHLKLSIMKTLVVNWGSCSFMFLTTFFRFDHCTNDNEMTEVIGCVMLSNSISSYRQVSPFIANTLILHALES